MGKSVFKTLTGKLSFTSTLPFVLVMIVLGTFTVIRMEREIRLLSARNLESITEVSALMVRTEVEVSVRNYLRSLAEKNRDIMELYYTKAQRGEITEAEAQKRVREIFLDPKYGKIGATGYLAGVTSRGILAIHPKSPGTDASGMEFMQKAMAMKNGYLEYQWKNVGETEERAKVGYLSYFEPWDIMVWASSYKEEFTDLLDLKSVAGSLESLQVEIGRAHV